MVAEPDTRLEKRSQCSLEEGEEEQSAAHAPAYRIAVWHHPFLSANELIVFKDHAIGDCARKQVSKYHQSSGIPSQLAGEEGWLQRETKWQVGV